eukprot:TRINITY_DN22912_c0_g1_i1.p1 TRINITY_DN22912_c0_g1~~TRINITY_DN22912_c0_g1_i1.p1  ORF type:complete len:239 (+),score=116.57 TRINITY_DN22912_c0_g1_i1:49-717(+)
MPKKGKGKKGKGGGAKAEAQDSIETILDEMYYMGPNYNEKRRAKYRKQIDDAFKMFERHTDGTSKERTCDWREVKTIVRSLDLNPTKEQLASMLDEVEDSAPSSFIKYERLEALLLEVLMTKEYNPKNPKNPPPEGETEQFTSKLLVRDSEQSILDAFRALDTQNKRELEAEAFGNVMMQAGRPGEAFEREEVVDMIQAACDPDSTLIKYDDSMYIDQLAHD